MYFILFSFIYLKKYALNSTYKKSIHLIRILEFILLLKPTLSWFESEHSIIQYLQCFWVNKRPEGKMWRKKIFVILKCKNIVISDETWKFDEIVIKVLSLSKNLSLLSEIKYTTDYEQHVLNKLMQDLRQHF